MTNDIQYLKEIPDLVSEVISVLEEKPRYLRDIKTFEFNVIDVYDERYKESELYKVFKHIDDINYEHKDLLYTILYYICLALEFKYNFPSDTSYIVNHDNELKEYKKILNSISTLLQDDDKTSSHSKFVFKIANSKKKRNANNSLRKYKEEIEKIVSDLKNDNQKEFYFLSDLLMPGFLVKKNKNMDGVAPLLILSILYELFTIVNISNPKALAINVLSIIPSHIHSNLPELLSENYSYDDQFKNRVNKINRSGIEDSISRRITVNKDT